MLKINIILGIVWLGMFIGRKILNKKLKDKLNEL
nr:MAG TPA: hypothetical protein [Caudoviricetes sp.]